MPAVRTLPSTLLLLALAGLPGCSTQQAYGGGQAWQRQECNKLMDADQRSRCMASANTSYDDYKRQADAAKANP